MIALLLGGGLQALSVSYSLKRIGWTVNVLSSESMFLYCAFVDKTVTFDLSVESIADYIKNNGISVIIPMSDNYTRWLSKNKDQLETVSNVKCAAPHYESLNIANDKSAFLKFCTDNNIPCPKTEPVNQENIDEVSGKIGFPALIKPDFSVGAQGITRVDSLTDLHENIRGVLGKYGTCTLQEYIDNRDFYYNVMLYRYSDGTYAQYVVTKIFRFFPKSGGSSSCCVSVDEPQLVEICKHALDRLDWIGFADFDVLFDLKRKQYKVIEINPRVPASLRAADISGVNFPEIMVFDLMFSKKKDMIYEPGKCLRYLGLDCMWLVSSLKDFSVKSNWFKFFGKNVYYQDLYANSPFLIFGILAHGMKRLFQKFLRRA